MHIKYEKTEIKILLTTAIITISLPIATVILPFTKANLKSL